MMDSTTIEMQALDAWPGLEEIMLDGWLLRFSGGHTRRANSVNLLRPGSLPVPGKIATCEGHYRARGLPTVFRLAHFAAQAAELDAELAARGYERQDETCVRLCDLSAPLPDGGDGGDVPVTTGAPPAIWFETHAGLTGLTEERRRRHAAIVGRIAPPVAFARVAGKDKPPALGMASLADGAACLGSIVTAPDHRRRGLGRAVTLALMKWAKAAGARTAFLQVEATNLPALRLYEGLGFGTEAYRYHYRVRRDETVGA